MDLRTVNTNALAFIGDGIYEVYIRKHVLQMGTADVNKLHKLAVKYVKAQAQSLVMKDILRDLSPEEEKLVKRARNHRQSTKAKNVDMVTYKWATAFEALLGYLYYKEDMERMEEIIRRGIEITEKNNE